MPSEDNRTCAFFANAMQRSNMRIWRADEETAVNIGVVAVMVAAIGGVFLDGL
jgi:hypothetical protein